MSRLEYYCMIIVCVVVPVAFSMLGTVYWDLWWVAPRVEQAAKITEQEQDKWIYVIKEVLGENRACRSQLQTVLEMKCVP